LHNLVAGGFTGTVYPVNARADVVQSLTAYRTLSDIPAAVELAVVVVPAEQVVGVARDCATAGVRAVLVISAGFAETGDAGGRRQRELLDICRGAPEDAARAVALAARHGRWRARPEGSFVAPSGCRPDQAAAFISAALADGSSWLEPTRVAALLDCYGLPLVTTRVVPDAELAVAAAAELGGTSAELIKDVAVRITPVTDLDAREMVRSLKTFALLDGFRGATRCDVAAVEEVPLRVGAMVEAHPEIAELDCNPVIVGPDGAVIVDARVRVAAIDPAPPLPSLTA
jgi:acyl-CoA synthetase (NDP forming)